MHVQPGQKGYPLRPEHVESLFLSHRTIKGDEWIRAGADVLRSLERLKLPCGYAAVRHSCALVPRATRPARQLRVRTHVCEPHSTGRR
jgi:hypothetical protein